MSSEIPDMKNILVTGSAGFVGTHLLKRLAGKSETHVRAAYASKSPRITAPNISPVSADLLNWKDCREVVQGCDTVIHLAGRLSTTAVMTEKPVGPIRENTILNANMLEAASEAGVKQFLWLSSTTGYPIRSHSLKEEEFFDDDPCSPFESVGWMSRYTEKLSWIYAEKSKTPFDVIALRPTTLFGEYDDFNPKSCHAMIAILNRVLQRDNPIEIWGTGEDRRDYLYVGDLIGAMMEALEKGKKKFEAFNIGMGKTFSLNEMVQKMLSVTGFNDLEVIHNMKKQRPTFERAIDCTKAKSFLGFTAKTSIEEGLIKTIDWFRSEIDNPGKQV